MKGERERDFSFSSTATDRATLRRSFEKSRFDENAYLDIYAYRNV